MNRKIAPLASSCSAVCPRTSGAADGGACHSNPPPCALPVTFATDAPGPYGKLASARQVALDLAAFTAVAQGYRG